jgi:hypothetical protein
MCPLYYIFNFVDYTNHLFIWLDPEVVAHDALIDEGGLFKFSFWIARAIFFWWDGIYIDITGKKL